MAVKITVRQANALDKGAEPAASASSAAKSEEPSLIFDMPRIFIGRGEGADFRLPDPSVSQRHASLRQRGNEIVIVDEGSTNGTALDSVLLPPQSPRVLRSGDLVRIGRVWLEIRIDPLLMPNAGPAASKGLALELVTQALASQGEDAGPRLVVVDGPDTGKSLTFDDPTRRHCVGRAPEVDLVLEDESVARRHIELGLKGDSLLVKDLGSGKATLEGAALSVNDTPWRPGQTLRIGKTSLLFEFPAAVALAELSRCADETMKPGDVPPKPRIEGDESPTPPPASESGPLETPAPRSVGPASSANANWSVTDAVVFLFAAAVLVLSVLAYLFLMRN